MKNKPIIKPYKLNKLQSRLKGYNRNFRGRFLLLQQKYLSPSEFVVWDLCYSVLADWDKRNHANLYSSFDYTHAEIAFLLGNDPSTVSKIMKTLFQKDLLYFRSDGRTGVRGYVRTNNAIKGRKIGVVNLLEEIRKTPEDGEEILIKDERFQESTLGKDEDFVDFDMIKDSSDIGKDLGSFKGKSSVIPEVTDKDIEEFMKGFEVSS